MNPEIYERYTGKPNAQVRDHCDVLRDRLRLYGGDLLRRYSASSKRQVYSVARRDYLGRRKNT